MASSRIYRGDAEYGYEFEMLLSSLGGMRANECLVRFAGLQKLIIIIDCPNQLSFRCFKWSVVELRLMAETIIQMREAERASAMVMGLTQRVCERHTEWRSPDCTATLPTSL